VRALGSKQGVGSVFSVKERIRPFFRTGFAVALLLALCVALPASGVIADELTTVFLARHAEKVLEGDDPALSETGVHRAQALASLLRDAGIEAVYSTDYARTRDTATPLASLLGLELTLYDPTKLDDLAAGIQRRGGRCLVVGHSNTTPDLVALLGGAPGAPIDEESEYDRLYVVTIGAGGEVETIVLRY